MRDKAAGWKPFNEVTVPHDAILVFLDAPFEIAASISFYFGFPVGLIGIRTLRPKLHILFISRKTSSKVCTNFAIGDRHPQRLGFFCDLIQLSRRSYRARVLRARQQLSHALCQG